MIGSFSKGCFSVVATIAIIEKDPSDKDPIAIGRFAAHKKPKLCNILFGGREVAPKEGIRDFEEVFCQQLIAICINW